jgi:hypothetical protein
VQSSTVVKKASSRRAHTPLSHESGRNDSRYDGLLVLLIRPKRSRFSRRLHLAQPKSSKVFKDLEASAPRSTLEHKVDLE